MLGEHLASPDLPDVQRWGLSDLQVMDGYAGAVFTAGGERSIADRTCGSAHESTQAAP